MEIISRLTVVKYSSTLNRAGFTCGRPTLDDYLHYKISQDIKRNLSTPYALVCQAGAVKGYYTICPSAVPTDGLAAGIQKKIPYPFAPIYLIGRLAIDKEIQGQGEGANLLLDALYRCYRISTEAAGVGVVVDAKDDAAKAWYLKFGFLPFPEQSMRLFLPMGTIEKLMKKESGDAGADSGEMEPQEGE